jgi:hypothetical protein
MLHSLFGAARGRSDCPRAVSDPLAPVVDVLDRAHRDLEPHGLAAALVEVDRLAGVIGMRGSHPSQIACSVTASHPAPATPEGHAYRPHAPATPCECTAGPLGHDELDHFRTRLEAYVEQVAARPVGCGTTA